MKKVLELLAVVVVTASLYVGCLSEDPYTVALPDIVAVEPGNLPTVELPDGPTTIDPPEIKPIPPIVVPPDDPPLVCCEPPETDVPDDLAKEVEIPPIKPPSPVGEPEIVLPDLVFDGTTTPIIPSPVGDCGGHQNGEIPTGTTAILRDVEVNSGTIISGGTAIITVSSSVELTQLYMQIEGVPGYTVLCLERVTPDNGVYTYTPVVPISQNLGNGSMRMIFTGRSGSQISTSIVRIVAARSVGSGNLQVSLSWNNRDDLDLHILTPSGGHIYYANKSVGNGRLDLDANVGCGNVSNENIYFDGTLADGIYRVWVNLYSKCGAAGAQYSVTASSGGRAFTFSRDGLSENGRFADSDSYGKDKVIGYITVQNGNIVATDYAALERQGLLKQLVDSQRKPKN